MFNGRKIVCLCGSTRFKEAFINVAMEEALKGNIVLSVSCFGHADGIVLNNEQKRIVDELHFDKIRLADEVIILNVNGYIGESTQNELRLAIDLNKPIKFLEPTKYLSSIIG